MEVLVVSEDARFTTWLVNTVTEAGWTARSALGPAAAAVVLRDWRPGVLVTDSRPEQLQGSWLDAIRQTRSMLVVVTPWARDGDLERSLSAGADGFVRCPVGSHELIARLRAITRWMPMPEDGDAPHALVQVGPVALDRTAGTVRVADVAIAVVGPELEVLDALMVTSPGVVSRDELARRAADGGPSSSSVDLIVRRLRVELENVEGWRRIETVRGVGFRMLDESPSDRRPAFTEPSTEGHGPFGRSREPVSP